MTPEWIYDAGFYHIYPLGLLGAPLRNDFSAAPVSRLDALHPWLGHIGGLNLNAVYLGPVFESTAHGYDTADYYTVDRRLGTNDTLKSLAAAMKSKGLRLVLDAVFNHVGRDFWAFRDLLSNGKASQYVDWFAGLDFEGSSPFGDSFAYEGWSGNYDLVRLNLRNPDVKGHLFEAVREWARDYGIAGLRLDAADLLDDDFLRDLRAHCNTIDPNFWLMGEIIHGDYRHWANPAMLDSTTNYECYKGLYSSHVDHNYFEIAYSLNRQFGEDGLYDDLMLYNFADNHDVDRVASSLENPAHLYPLYLLLATMPGVPSVYYGSEFGVAGKRTANNDEILRPALDLAQITSAAPQPDLPNSIRRVMSVRRDLPALRKGDYQQLYVAHEQIAFARSIPGQKVIVAANAAAVAAGVFLKDIAPGTRLEDCLNGETITASGGAQTVVEVPPGWGRIMLMHD